MSKRAETEITDLLLAWNEGEPSALQELAPLVDAELRRLARSYLRRERAGHTLQTTALINEAYVRLIDSRRVRWENRAHFYGLAARVMRQILVDFSRRRNYQKRGGGLHQITLVEAFAVEPGNDPDLLALDEALRELATVDQRKAQVVEMRFFGGLTEKEVALALNVSPETARRDWRLAKAWLLRRLSQKSK
ncbi:MAG TPA: sigma-70 family RNA polymerase sigma factor [Pyrinomonadaceae bacterium]|jgi:RNA polymerase sigma factor (TIGR02999 family)|nr:sigma-70 family RNA polymerase sigma factor [Pyrinomonadaceae bacterium]